MNVTAIMDSGFVNDMNTSNTIILIILILCFCAWYVLENHPDISRKDK